MRQGGAPQPGEPTQASLAQFGNETWQTTPDNANPGSILLPST
jgi:hypothetical protein